MFYTRSFTAIEAKISIPVDGKSKNHQNFDKKRTVTSFKVVRIY
jgi:hypothetical protein